MASVYDVKQLGSWFPVYTASMFEALTGQPAELAPITVFPLEADHLPSLEQLLQSDTVSECELLLFCAD